MKTIKKNSITKDNGSMLSQKTNEDFNKRQPLPSDFKKEKSQKNKGNDTMSSVNKLKSSKMKTEKQLNEDILKTTLLIQEKYPELSKYITEFTLTNPDKEHPEINVENLASYYDSLISVLKTYAPTHNTSDY